MESYLSINELCLVDTQILQREPRIDLNKNEDGHVTMHIFGKNKLVKLNFNKPHFKASYYFH